MDTFVQTLPVPAADGSSAAILASPDEGAHPAVLMLPDVFGLRPALYGMVERIASWGYTVLAPNLLYREHTVPLIPDMDLTYPEGMQEAMETTLAWTKDVPLDDTAADAEAWLDYLSQQSFVSGEKAALIGYCRGAVIGFHTAAKLGDRIAAAGLFHSGSLVTEGPDSPHLAASGIKAELLIRHADNDPGQDAAAQAALAEALDAAGVTYSQEVYPDAPHGYTMSDAWRFQAAGSEKHYYELYDLLGRTL